MKRPKKNSAEKLPALAQTQKLFLEALLEPLSKESRKDTSLLPTKKGLSQNFKKTANRIIAPNSKLTAVERLDLYHCQYWYRIIDSLAEDFPHLRTLLGEKRFWNVLERFLIACPPNSFTLRHLGAQLSDFIAKDRTLPKNLRSWAANITRFEYAFMESFAAGEFTAATSNDFAAAKLQLQPSVNILTLSQPVAQWLEEKQKKNEIKNQKSKIGATALKARRQLVTVWRAPNHKLFYAEEPLAILPLLQSFQKGGTLKTIINRLKRLPENSLLQESLTRWQRRGWIGLSASPLIYKSVTNSTKISKVASQEVSDPEEKSSTKSFEGKSTKEASLTVSSSSSK
jgi:hypothetical protein